MIKMKTKFFLFLIVLNVSFAAENFCEDWTLCQRVKCAPPPNPCPKTKPYLLYTECGCCLYCSETPRIGPCGECGKDLDCRTNNMTEYPVCQENQIVTLDYCGCCRTCKTIIEIGDKCDNDPKKPSSTVCAAGLQCTNGTCIEPQ